MFFYIERPLVIMALTAFLGCLMGTHLPEILYPYLWITFICSILIFFWTWYSSKQLWQMVFLLVLLIYAILSFQQNRMPKNSLAQLVPSNKITLTGILETACQQRDRSGWTGVFQVTQTQTIPVSGKLYLYTKSVSLDKMIGKAFMVTGRLVACQEPTNPGEFNYKQFLRLKQIHGFLTIYNERQIVMSEKQPIINHAKMIYNLRQHSLVVLEQCLSKQRLPIARALFLGDRNALRILEREKITKSGLAHLLAISGLHIGLLVGAWLAVCNWMGVPKIITGSVACFLAIGVCLLTGSQLPAQRAAIMLIVAVLLGFLYIKTDGLSVLAIIALMMLTEQPSRAYMAGFQLTFVATALVLTGLLFITGTTKTKWHNRLLQTIAISALVTLCLIPLTSYYFFQLSFLTVLTNLLAGVLLLIVLWAGVLTIIVGSCYLAGGIMCGWLLDQSIGLLQQMIDHSVLQFQASIYVQQLPAWQVVLFYFSLLALLLVRKQRILLACMLLIPMSITFNLIPKKIVGNEITFLNLAVGESTFIQTPGYRILIDTGTEREFLRRIKPFLASRGINRIDTVILTHQDNDHSGGLPACMLLFDVKQCLVGSKIWLENQQDLWTWIEKKNIPIRVVQKPDKIVIDEHMKIDIIWPPLGTREACNADSLSMMVTVDAFKLFFTGDSPASTEKQWWDLDKCHLLKAGHHGDEKSSSVYLINRLQPQWVVVMPGARNAYGFPDQATIKRFKKSGSMIMNTKKQGAVFFRWSSAYDVEKGFWY